MVVINGKNTCAYVYADIVDEATIKQIKLLVDQYFMKNIRVSIMADCHAGCGCVIGTTFQINDKIVPNLVGVDIGCGMLTVMLGKIDIDFKMLDNFIKENIPAGMDVNGDGNDLSNIIDNLRCYGSLKNIERLRKSIGSLGGGNHFIEIDKNENDEYYLIVHTGSRNLGLQVAKIYQDLAIKYHNNKIFNKKSAINELILKYKRLNLEAQIQNEIERIAQMNLEISIPRELCYLEGDEFDDYLYDMDICQSFAALNRGEIAKKIVDFLGLDYDCLYKFETVHNYINMNDKILRKGAISAYAGEVVLIPMNMRDGCIIARGKGNPLYNYSAPHGAGRIMSRAEAFKVINVDNFKKVMKGIYTTTSNENTIDESPFVYKPMASILNNINDTVEVLQIIKPVYNFKATQGE